MLPTPIIYALLAASAALAQQIVSSRDGNTQFNCPPRQTVETAYFGYCGAESNEPAVLPLQGILVEVFYNNAPNDYKTTMNSVRLGCGYGPGGGDSFDCNYFGGNGQPLTSTFGGACPELSSTVPRPSGGGNYRRTTPPTLSLSRRAIVNQRPRFVCPWTSGGANPRYFAQTLLASGRYATEYSPSGSVSSSDIYILCQTDDGNSCYYVQNESGAPTYIGASSNQNGEDNDPFCPSTLCNAIMDGTGNMRRELAPSPDIAKRQVDTRSLREKLAAQRRVSGVWA